MSLTEKRVRDASPGEKTAIHWDSQVKGMGLRVTPAGAKAVRPGLFRFIR